MCNRINFFLSIVLLMLLHSCATTSVGPSATPPGPRTIILNGNSFTESDTVNFLSWCCTDLLNDKQILAEVGYFVFLDTIISILSEMTDVSDSLEVSGLPRLDELLKSAGFVLYDGGNSGEITIHRRIGLEHRWDWGPNGADYSFVIKPDGTGAYYDFSNVPKGESTKPNSIYKCYRR